MIERYELYGAGRATNLPNPHDFVIKQISMQDEFLVLEFEDDISRHDVAAYYHPEAKHLKIRYHMLFDDDDSPEFVLFKGEQRKYEWVYILLKQKRLFDLPKDGNPKLEYLHTYVGSGVIIDMCKFDAYRLELDADYVEYEWTE